MQIWVCPM